MTAKKKMPWEKDQDAPVPVAPVETPQPPEVAVATDDAGPKADKRPLLIVADQDDLFDYIFGEVP